MPSARPGPAAKPVKQRMQMNALKHGCDAAPANDAAIMRALGEDPARYEALKQELSTDYGPGDTLRDRQIEDLARLYWRRERLERMQTGLMRRALQAVEERQRERRREIAAVTFDSSCWAAIDAVDVGGSDDPSVRWRLQLSLLGVLREQVRQRVFTPRQWGEIRTYYQGRAGWRPARLRHLLWLFLERANPQRQDEKPPHDFVSQYFKGGEAGVENHYQELLALIDEEIADVEEEFQHEVAAQEARDAADRDACLAPEGETWEMLLRQEAGLDRAIDRKVRILLTLRKEHAQLQREAAGPPGDELLEAGADTPSSVCDSGQDGEAPPSLRETQTPKGRGLRQPVESAEDASADTRRRHTRQCLRPGVYTFHMEVNRLLTLPPLSASPAANALTSFGFAACSVERLGSCQFFGFSKPLCFRESRFLAVLRMSRWF